MLARIIVMVVLAIILALWLNGRYQRSRWSRTATLVPAFPIEEPYSTAVIFFPGAFNSAIGVSQGMIQFWGRFGDVYLVEYPLERLDLQETIRSINDQLHRYDRNYTRFVLVGASMGGILAMELYRSWNHPTAPGWGAKVGIIGCDVPQCADHLPWAARLVRFVQPGPITNWLLSWVPGIVFRPQYDKLSEGTDMEGLQRHIDAMQRFEMSAWRDHLAVIVKSHIQDPRHFRAVDSFYLRSETDDVIKAEPADQAWVYTFPQSCSQYVPKAFHSTFMEHRPEWWTGFVAACGYLRVPQVR